MRFILMAGGLLLLTNVAQAQEARPLNDKAAARAVTGVYKIDSLERNTSGCTGPQVASKPPEPYVAVQTMRVQEHIQVRLRPCPDVKTCLQWAADPWNERGSKGMLKQPGTVYNAEGQDGTLVGNAPVAGLWDEKAQACVGAQLAVSVIRVDAEGTLRGNKWVYRFDVPAAGPEAPRCRTSNVEKTYGSGGFEVTCGAHQQLAAKLVKPVPACAKADCTNSAK
jgi:hypothetical protein